MTHGFVRVEKCAAALDAGDAAALFAINPEYAPFWCPMCRASYCGDDYRSWVTFDEGSYDATSASARRVTNASSTTDRRVPAPPSGLLTGRGQGHGEWAVRRPLYDWCKGRRGRTMAHRQFGRPDGG